MSIASSANCPCDSGLTFAQCCEPFLKRKSKPATAEQLLRSRYSAFVVGDVDYIVDTHHSKTKKDVKRDEIAQWSKESTWKGMKVLEKEAGEASDDKGVLIFHAQYEQNGKHQDHMERSFFEKENGEWRFLDAHGIHQGTYVRAEPKVGRNDPCACGSGKKSKKCHGAA